MSPVWLVLAAPALLLPFGVVFLFEDEAMPSLVEQAVSSLPIPGEASRWGLCDGLHRDAHEFVPA